MATGALPAGAGAAGDKRADGTGPLLRIGAMDAPRGAGPEFCHGTLVVVVTGRPKGGADIRMGLLTMSLRGAPRGVGATRETLGDGAAIGPKPLGSLTVGARGTVGTP